MPEEKRPPDPEILKLKNLLEPFKTEQQKRLIRDYIKNHTDKIPYIVIENWLSGVHIPSQTIKNDIINALESFPLNSLLVANIPVIALKEKTEENPLPKKPSPARLRRDNIIKANEKQLEIMRKRAAERRNQNTRIKNDKEYEALAEKLKQEGKIV